MIRYGTLDVLCVVLQSTSNPSRYTIKTQFRTDQEQRSPMVENELSFYRDAVRLINVTV